MLEPLRPHLLRHRPRQGARRPAPAELRMLIPVILSGGAGTRLWPLSRELYPKQLLPLTGERTMLQETALRLQGLDAGAPVVVCNEAHRFLVAEQLRQLHDRAARHRCSSPSAATPRRPSRWRRSQPSRAARADARDPVLLVLPADHVIRDVAAFQTAVRDGAAGGRGRASWSPSASCRSAPETGYGYIRARRRRRGAAFRIAQFVEKPDCERARGVRRVRATTTGTAACSCSARGAICEELRALRAGDRAGVPRRRSRGAQRGSGFHAHRSGGVRSLPERLHRLRGDGEDGGCGGRAAGCRLERCRLLVGAARRPAMPMRTATSRTATCSSKTRSGCYLYSREPAGCGGRSQGPRGGRDQGCRAGRAEGSRAGREEAGRAPQGARPLRALAAPRGVPALGQLRQHR